MFYLLEIIQCISYLGHFTSSCTFGLFSAFSYLQISHGSIKIRIPVITIVSIIIWRKRKTGREFICSIDICPISFFSYTWRWCRGELCRGHDMHDETTHNKRGRLTRWTYWFVVNYFCPARGCWKHRKNRRNRVWKLRTTQTLQPRVL